MRNDEILQKYREQDYDEGMDAALNHGRKIGLTVCTIAAALLSLLGLWIGDSIALRTTSIILAVMWACESYGKYRFFRYKYYLFLIVLFLFIAATNLYDYLKLCNLW